MKIILLSISTFLIFATTTSLAVTLTCSGSGIYYNSTSNGPSTFSFPGTISSSTVIVVDGEVVHSEVEYAGQVTGGLTHFGQVYFKLNSNVEIIESLGNQESGSSIFKVNAKVMRYISESGFDAKEIASGDVLCTKGW